MEPIDRAGITELVVQRIKELLERGELKAGSRLPPEHGGDWNRGGDCGPERTVGG